MPSMPLVTVLMTVYNGSEYLDASVQSIINQTFEDFEFLIVNDCSTDDSTKIIESFNDQRIVIYDNEKNIVYKEDTVNPLELIKLTKHNSLLLQEAINIIHKPVKDVQIITGTDQITL